jgi:hypothetical protein
MEYKNHESDGKHNSYPNISNQSDGEESDSMSSPSPQHDQQDRDTEIRYFKPNTSYSCDYDLKTDLDQTHPQQQQHLLLCPEGANSVGDIRIIASLILEMSRMTKRKKIPANFSKLISNPRMNRVRYEAATSSGGVGGGNFCTSGYNSYGRGRTDFYVRQRAAVGSRTNVNSSGGGGFVDTDGHKYVGLTKRFQAGLFHGLPPTISIATNTFDATQESRQSNYEGKSGKTGEKMSGGKKNTTTTTVPLTNIIAGYEFPSISSGGRGSSNINSGGGPLYYATNNNNNGSAGVLGRDLVVSEKTEEYHQHGKNANGSVKREKEAIDNLESSAMNVGCGSGNGMNMMFETKNSRVYYTGTPCVFRGAGDKHGTKVHNDIEKIVDIIHEEANKLAVNGEDPGMIDDLLSTALGSLKLGDSAEKSKNGLGPADDDNVTGGSDNDDDDGNASLTIEQKSTDKNKNDRHQRRKETAYETSRINSICDSLRLMDPCALNIIAELFAHKWIPVRAELPIFDETIKTATAVDLILWDYDHDKILLGEVKTGSNNVVDYNAHDGRSFMTTLHSTFCIKDTALNRAVVQLLFALYIISSRYDVNIDGAVVIRSSSVKNTNKATTAATTTTTTAGTTSSSSLSKAQLPIESNSISNASPSPPPDMTTNIMHTLSLSNGLSGAVVGNTCGLIQFYKIPEWLTTPDSQILLYLRLVSICKTNLENMQKTGAGKRGGKRKAGMSKQTSEILIKDLDDRGKRIKTIVANKQSVSPELFQAQTKAWIPDKQYVG